MLSAYLQQLIPNLLLVYGAAGTIVFFISYIIFFNWRKTAAGKALLYFVLGLIIVFTVNIIGTFVGVHYPQNEYPGRVFVRTAAYGYMAYTVTHLVYVLWSNWKKGFLENTKIELRKPPIRLQ